MSTDYRTDIRHDNFLALTLDCLFKFFGAFRIIRMGNHNNAVFEIFGVSFKVFYKSRNNIALTSDFCNIDKMTFIVNTEERFNLQSFAECCGNSGNSTASLELIKVFNNKPMTYFYTGVFNVFF